MVTKMRHEEVVLAYLRSQNRGFAVLTLDDAFLEQIISAAISVFSLRPRTKVQGFRADYFVKCDSTSSPWGLAWWQPFPEVRLPGHCLVHRFYTAGSDHKFSNISSALSTNSRASDFVFEAISFVFFFVSSSRMLICCRTR